MKQKLDKRRIVLIFDLDDTLISTKKVFSSLENAFVQKEIERKRFQKLYRESKVQGALSLKRFIYLVKKYFSLSEKEIRVILKEAFKEGKKFLYPDTYPFLKKWSERAHLFLVSFGNKDFQMHKIKNAGIFNFFEKIFITNDQQKREEVGNILKNFFKKKKIFFVDDNQETLFCIKKVFKRIITVHINREKKKNSTSEGDKNIDFSIKNLKELDNLLEKSLRKPRALLLFSGGLDSILAAKILAEQGVEVKGLTFKSYFFDASQAKKAARELGIKLKVVDFSKEHLKVVQSPKYGYGQSMNPCIDCHLLMLKYAKRIMKKEGFDFVATGEVLGERPMSQNKKALLLLERESSLSGYLLRPLSAKLLAQTIPEQRGLVKREKLLDIFGRSRKRQIELAKKFKIKEYPAPAGGCLLTDLEFGKRLKELFKRCSRPSDSDIYLLRYGRHFWKEKILIVVGRDEKENKAIKRLAQKRDILVEMENYPGPTALLRNYDKGKIASEILKCAQDLVQYYSTKARGKNDVEFKVMKFKK